MVKIKLDHCVIHVSNWERSNAFYRDVMGAELVEIGAGWSYRFGDTQLNCHGPNALAHLEEHGVQVEVGPVPRFGSRGRGTSVYFRDPDGSLMEFISYASNGERI